MITEGDKSSADFLSELLSAALLSEYMPYSRAADGMLPNFLEAQKPRVTARVYHSHNASRISYLSPQQGKHGDQQEPRTQSA